MRKQRDKYFEILWKSRIYTWNKHSGCQQDKLDGASLTWVKRTEILNIDGKGQ